LSNLNFPRSREAGERIVRGPAPLDQLEELRSLAESDLIRDGVRSRVLARVEQGITAQQATDAIAYLRRLHREAERSAAGGEAAA
jgi:hypothetical protein